MSTPQNSASRKLSAILHDVIRSVEQETDISPDDPALVELKRILLLRIAALQLDECAQETGAPAAEVPPEPPIDAN